MVADFQAGLGPPLLLVSLKAGGTGLNLTAASQVIHYDRWWNPAVEDQATDRAWRIGQGRTVNVHKLVCEGTVEERIAALIDQKRALADAVVGSGESWLSELSTADLRDLVRLESPSWRASLRANEPSSTVSAHGAAPASRTRGPTSGCTVDPPRRTVGTSRPGGCRRRCCGRWPPSCPTRGGSPAPRPTHATVPSSTSRSRRVRHGARSRGRATTRTRSTIHTQPAGDGEGLLGLVPDRSELFTECSCPDAETFGTCKHGLAVLLVAGRRDLDRPGRARTVALGRRWPAALVVAEPDEPAVDVLADALRGAGSVAATCPRSRPGCRSPWWRPPGTVDADVAAAVAAAVAVLRAR